MTCSSSLLAEIIQSHPCLSLPGYPFKASMKRSGLVARHSLLWDLVMMWCTTLSFIDLIVLFLIFVKDAEIPC